MGEAVEAGMILFRGNSMQFHFPWVWIWFSLAAEDVLEDKWRSLYELISTYISNHANVAGVIQGVPVSMA